MRLPQCQASRWRMTCGRTVLLAVVSWALLAASIVSASDDEAKATEPVIVPGQEALIASMLGRGMALPDCALVSCAVDHTVILATYGCADGDVTLELGHPQTATDTTTRTAQFAITVRSGTPPSRDFQLALVSLVRSREANFVWDWAEPGADAETDDAPE